VLLCVSITQTTTNLMPISMSLDARYVTQASVWSNPRTGHLTDAKIRRYQKAGYYGGLAPQEKREPRALTSKEKVRRLLAKLLE
jgi:hypothetical protein